MESLFKSNFDEIKNEWNIFIAGEIDIYNSDILKDEVQKLINEKKVNLLFDCKELTYIDSTGLGAFVSLLKRVKQYDGGVKLINVKANVLKLFKITDLDKIFQIEGENNA